MNKLTSKFLNVIAQPTIVCPIIDETLVDKLTIKSNARKIFMNLDFRVNEITKGMNEGMFKNLWAANPDPWTLFQMMSNFSSLNAYTCEAVTSNTDLLEQLRSERFDVGIAEPISICGFGLFDHLQIPSSIGAISGVQFDLVSYYIGEPLALSYAPSMSSTDGENMGFFARMNNGIETLVGMEFFKSAFMAEAEVLTKVFGNDYSSDYGDLIGRTSLVLTNSNPYINYPRPLLHKTIEIGGISVDVKMVEDLGEWDKVLNERKHTVFISFGSVTKSKDMPKEWKNSMVSVFASLPEVTFIWKYEEPTTIADHLPNVHLGSWLPQNALLADPRFSLFITHGGLGSTTEVAHFGKPAIMIPVFADQPRNAAMLARHGGTLSLEKEDLGNTEKLREAVRRILNDASFETNATRLAKMLQEQPVSAKDLVISHAEFVAKYGPLKQIDSNGRKLSIVEYYLLDVMVCILLLVSVVILLLYFTFRPAFKRMLSILIGNTTIDNNKIQKEDKKLQ